MKYQTRKSRAMLQKGFTLIELLVVIVLLGILIAIFAPKMQDAGRRADGKLLYSVVDRISNNWRIVTQTCGVSSAIGTSPITTTASTDEHLKFLVLGGNTATAYAGCVQTAGIEPAVNAGVLGDGSAGNPFNVNGYNLTIANIVVNGRNKMAATFTKVDDSTVLELVQNYNTASGTKSMKALGSDNTTDPAIRYVLGTNAAGYHDITIIK